MFLIHPPVISFAQLGEFLKALVRLGWEARSAEAAASLRAQPSSLCLDRLGVGLLIGHPFTVSRELTSSRRRNRNEIGPKMRIILTESKPSWLLNLLGLAANQIEISRADQICQIFFDIPDASRPPPPTPPFLEGSKQPWTLRAPDWGLVEQWLKPLNNQDHGTDMQALSSIFPSV